MVLASALTVVVLAAGCAPSQSSAASPSSVTAASDAVGTSSASAADAGPAWALDFAGSGERIKSAGLQILDAEGTVEHYHAHLDIFVDGNKVAVPANIGFAVDASGQATGISALHTHDTSGVVHIEAATAGKKYILGQLLTEWGVLGTDGSIGGKTGRGDQGWHLVVNGAKDDADPTSLTLRAHQEIALVYGKDPASIPASFDFPAGE
ncbi:hypothetical protein IV498_07420 [Paenarthrobacter sp. Z7-10]|nr:hypothetical protein [Paenarthrobacter sp. Z7-10]